MSATGILADAIEAITDALAALGFTAVTDPRQARPYTVMVELPRLDAFNYNVGDISTTVRILGVPPANKNATDYLITAVDTIMNSDIAVIDGRPSLATYGNQDLPTYDLTVRIAVQRS
jgi:hypothetical protein